MFKRNIFIKILMLGFVCLFSGNEMFAQSRCLYKSEARTVIESISNPAKPKNRKKIKRELLNMQKTQTAINERIFRSSGNKKQLIAKLNKTRKQNVLRLCEILKEVGWLNEKAIGKSGVEAVLFLIRNTTQTLVQKDLFPVITEATQKGLIPKANLAALIDKIRIKSGKEQIFGTQVKIRGEIGYLYPIENEATVDKRRELYGLPPISNFIKIIETQYRTIVVKMPQPPQLILQRKNVSDDIKEEDDKKLLGLEDEDSEVLNIESSLVNLNVRILTKDMIGTRDLGLKKDDFLVYENGQLQEISFFSTTDTPFDLVLLLDLSGSTVQKQQLIAESASRFIKLARPKDRIAIVTFSDYPSIISELSGNKKELLKKVNQINDYGSSKIWDALDFTYKNILKPQTESRRSAVVFMTDGVDNTLIQNPLRPSNGSFYYSLRPSKITFTELLETVRKNDANIFPIYVDTEGVYAGRYTNEKSYRQARRTLKMLAEESGGQFYRATQIEDLSGIYKRVINDLSEVYSLGYEPKDDENKGNWRELEIKIKERPNLIVKSKRGYYAK